MAFRVKTEEVVHQRLRDAVLEMGQSLRGGVSFDLADLDKDLCIGVLNARREIVELDNLSHLGSMGIIAETIWRWIGSHVAEGDLLVTNDPYSGTAHVQDFTLLNPVFGGQKLIAFLMAQVHVPDIGGALNGSYNHDAEELLAEGVRITPIRLWTRGKRDEALFKMILLNSRQPDALHGALGAMFRALKQGELVIRDLIKTYGDETTIRAMDQIIRRVETFSRSFLRTLPDETNSGERILRGDGTGRESLAVRVVIRKQRESLTIDFSQTDRESKRFVNSSLGNTWRYATLPLALRLQRMIAVNGGLLKVVKIRTVEGSLVSPHFPAPTGWGPFHVGREIYESVNQAISAFPSQYKTEPEPSIGASRPHGYDGLEALLGDKEPL